MKTGEEYFYRCEFIVEILVNREQEYIKNRHNEYESEFEDTDFVDAKRWIRSHTISFCEQRKDKIFDRIRFEFHNARIDTIPIVEDGYFYWFDNNCLVNQERLLHRGELRITHACDIEVKEDELISIAKIEQGVKS